MSSTAASAAASAAAAAVSRQNLAMRAFRKAGATNPDRAAAPEEVGCRDSRVFRRMVRHGVFVEVERGRYYLDMDAARRFHRHRVVRILAFTTAVIILWLLCVLLFS